MAANNAANNPIADPPVNGTENTEAAANGHLLAVNGAEPEVNEDDSGETIFQLNINLPFDPKKIQIMVSSQEAIHDVRQSIVELPGTFQYSCFHLEHRGRRINDFVQIAEVDGLVAVPELTLIQDPYTEKDARLHVIRVREIIGAAGDRTDTLHGILAGTSLHDSVTFAAQASAAATPKEPLAVAGYSFQAPGVLANLVPQSEEAPIKTVKSIAVSPWNPPPYHLRQKGHLLYLLLTTNEGEQHQITAHVSGFYVNKSSNTKFDPFPRAAPKAHSAHSLLTLISDLSVSFDTSFKKLLEANGTKEPLAVFQITNAIPSNPWVVPSTASALVAHQSDITRTQEAYLISGIENTDTLRDWNEEFQSTRELPKENVHDRVFRERLTSKLFADYTESAARGAVLVARGEVAPLNPTEARDAQIFVYNNVFYSFGADGVGTFATEGGDEAARVATGKDVMGVRMVNQLDIEGLFTPGTVVVDYLGKRIVGQSIVPGIFKQRDPGENQIDYGAVDGRDVVADNEQFIPTFEKLSKALKIKKHAVWDKEGKRHILEGSVETKGLLGTDGRKYVLDLYRITPLDISWMEEFGTAISSTESADAASPGAYPHRMTVLRPELIEAYWKVKMREWVSTEVASRRKTQKDVSDTTKKVEDKPSVKSAGDSKKDEVAEEASIEATKETEDNERIDISDFNFSLNPDAFSGQVPQTEAEKEEMTKDEEDVKLACKFLRESVLPELVNDLKEGDVGSPMDGQSFSQLLHKRGINIRYLGKIAQLTEGTRLESVRGLAIQEMVSRAFKHVASKYLRALPIPFTGSCIAHLLNCLLGTGLSPKPQADIDTSMSSLYPESDLAFEKVSPESLKEEIENQILRRYQYTINNQWTSEIKHMQLLREVALKLGLQLEVKDYHFTPQQNGVEQPPAPVDGSAQKENSINGQSTGSKKKKKARDGSPVAAASTGKPHTFSPDDILNIVPIVKDAAPRSSLAEEALEAGRISIMQGQKKLGQELLMESLSLHEQIYGIIHPQVARVYNSLSMLYYQLDEKEAAVELARKAVVVSERTLGVDNSETLLSYLNLALFCHGSGDSQLALSYIKHALDLWKIVYGPNHPDSITTLNNAAVMLQHLKDYHESRLWFEASLNICEQVYGKNSINAATLLFQLAQALALDNESKGAVNRMRESYNIFLGELGADDKNTKEAESWLEQLTQNAVSIAKHEKDVQNRRVRSGIRVSPRVTLQPQVGQRVEASGRGSVNNARGLDSRTIDELVKFIEGADQKTKSKKRTGRPNPKRRGGSVTA